MITKEEFTGFINAYQNFDSHLNQLEKAFGNYCNLHETDLGESVSMMLDQFLYSHFTECGQDYIYWWLFEDVDKKIYQKDEPDLFNGAARERVYDVNELDDLWKYMLLDKETYFKNA